MVVIAIVLVSVMPIAAGFLKRWLMMRRLRRAAVRMAAHAASEADA
jgi:hypothetical protein